jgi:hypothetical protein
MRTSVFLQQGLLFLPPNNQSIDSLTLHDASLVLVVAVGWFNGLDGWDGKVVELRPDDVLRGTIDMCVVHGTSPLGFQNRMSSQEAVDPTFS